MIKTLKSKKLDHYLLFLLIFLLPFSDKLNFIDAGIVNVFAFRVVLGISFIVLLLKGEIKLRFFIESKWLSVFLLFLFFFGALSLIWVDSKISAYQQLFYLFTAILSYIVILSLLKNIEKPLLIVSRAWIFSFVIMAFFGILEIMTNAHFISGFTDHLATFDFIRPSFNAPLASFSNPNDFSIYLSFGIVFFIYFFQSNKNQFALIAIVVAYFLMYNTLSRFGLLSFYIMIVFFGILSSYRNNWGWIKKNYQLMIAYVFAFVFVICFMIYTNPVGKPVNKDGKVEIVTVPMTALGMDFLFSTSALPQDSTGSTAIRKNLILNGLDFTLKSNFLGIGAGQFEYKMKEEKPKYFTDGIYSPHHFLIEIVSQYGLIGLMLILIFFVSVLYKLFIHFKRYRRYSISNEFILLISLIIVYVITSNSSSSYISHPINWIILTVISYVLSEVTTAKISDND